MNFINNGPSIFQLVEFLFQMLCYLLECMLTPETTPADCPKELYELYFVFCCVWAFGGCLFQDQVNLQTFISCDKEIISFEMLPFFCDITLLGALLNSLPSAKKKIQAQTTFWACYLCARTFP